VLPLDSLGAADRPLAGGKGASLGELVRAGFPVPAGFVVTTAAFREALGALDPDGSIPRAVAALDPGDHQRVARVTAELRARVASAPLSGALAAALAAAYAQLGAAPGAAAGTGAAAGPVPVAVRSSGTAEDAASASFAGLQDSYLWVRGAEQVAAALRRCWASLYSVASVTYRLRRGPAGRQRLAAEAGAAMAVVVQRMVDARVAGVMLTRSPTTGDRSVVTVEGAWGLGSAVVGGEVTPDAWTVSKVTGEILKRTVASKPRRHRPDSRAAGSGVVAEEVPAELRDRPCLSDAEVRALARLGARVERHYGTPQDIEWALERDLEPLDLGAAHGLFLLQSRPETAWSGRETTPVATPKPRAFDHVMARFSAAGPSDPGRPAGHGSGTGSKGGRHR
jgi:pyruvate,water dikinase